MKKLFTSCLIVSSLVLSPALKAQDAVTTDNEGTPVGLAANEGTNAAKKKRWQNIALAAGAVAVAVTALILVANNDGHHHHKSDIKH
jgi:hypothetical protein